MRSKYGFIKANLGKFKELSDPVNEAILKDGQRFQTVEIKKIIGGKGKKVTNSSLVAQ